MIETRLPGAQVVFSTRQGGVSEGPYESLNLGILTEDAPERVRENRAILAAEAGLPAESIAMGWQVHGTELREWNEAPEEGGRGGSEAASFPIGGFAAPGAELPRVDAHLTARRGVGLLVLVADCLPVALAGGGKVAIVHCGWRGLAGGILERALERGFAGGEPPAAAIGPGIGPCCYDVGDEVLEAFAGGDGVADGRMLDLRAVVRAKLEARGVRQIESVNLCTSCREDLFFSHRRDGGITGRQAGLVWMPTV